MDDPLKMSDLRKATLERDYPNSKVDIAVSANETVHKLSDKLNKKIPLMEIFGPTIQGEGVQIGVQTYFLRTGLCDFKCIMCDSMHAVDPKQVKAHGEWLTQEQIFDKFVTTGVYRGPDSAEWMTFTGGNPCMHDLTYLIHLLRGLGLKVNVETQGTLLPAWIMDVHQITVSPKGPGMGEITDVRILDNFMLGCIESPAPVCMKIVVFDQRDLDFAVEMYERYKTYPVNGWFLSLGNPNPPGLKDVTEFSHSSRMTIALQDYRILFDDIQNHRVLSKFRFLPQWHWFVWGDEKGR